LGVESAAVLPRRFNPIEVELAGVVGVGGVGVVVVVDDDDDKVTSGDGSITSKDVLLGLGFEGVSESDAISSDALEEEEMGVDEDDDTSDVVTLSSDVVGVVEVLAVSEHVVGVVGDGGDGGDGDGVRRRFK